MFQKIVVAIDGSEGSRIALVHAAILTKKLGTELVSVWVRGSLPHYPETIDEVAEEEESSQAFYEGIRAEVARCSADQGVAITPVMRSGHPAQEILKYAQENHTDLIVIGSRGHSRIWGQLLGHTADRVNEHAPCSVLIVRSEAEQAAYRRMLIGFDGSAGSQVALETGLQLAKKLGAKVRVVWVHLQALTGNDLTDAGDAAWAEEHFNAVLRDRIESTAGRHGVEVAAAYRLGNAAYTLATFAQEDECRLIVLGHQGHSGLWGKLIGGVTDRVSHYAKCDVLVVREKQPEFHNA